jgi:hypothetical protein
MMIIKKLNIFYSPFLLIWQSIQMNLLNGFDGAGRITGSMTLLIFVLNGQFFIKKNERITNVLLLRILMVIWVSANSFFLYDPKLFNVPLLVFFFNTILVPFVVFLSISAIDKKNIGFFLKLSEKTLFLAIIINYFGSNFMEGRLLNEELNINEIVLVNAALMTIVLLNSLYFKRHLLTTLILIVIPVVFSILSGSRMSFGSTIILLFGFAISSFNKINWKTILNVFLISLSVFLLTKNILSKTVVFDRLLSTSTQNEELTHNEAEGTVFEYFGDRGSFYVEGLRIFFEHPITGIGLLNYAQTHDKVSHVEYMIYLAELGAIGFILYFLFLRAIYNQIKSKKQEKIGDKSLYFLPYMLLNLIFCGLVLFLYNSFAVAYIFGLLFLLSKRKIYSMNLV